MNDTSYLDSAYEELAPIGIGACIGHANNSWSSMRHCKIMIYSVTFAMKVRHKHIQYLIVLSMFSGNIILGRNVSSMSVTYYEA